MARPFRTISEAVYTAAGGTKICVAHGTYLESDRTLGLLYKDGIVLEGGYEPRFLKRDPVAYPTVIDGSGLKAGQAVIELYYARDITIDGFSIRGTHDYGIVIYRGERIKIKNCVIKNMNDSGIYVSQWANAIWVERCDLSFNNGNGIYAQDAWGIWLVNCRMESNQASGVYFAHGSFTGSIITGCSINKNKNGISLISAGSSIAITNNLLNGNVYAGIYADGYDNPTILNNTIVNSDRGLVWERWPSSSLEVPVVKNNIIAFNQKGIIFNTDAPTSKRPEIDFNDLWKNSQGDYQGCSKGSHDISGNPLFYKGVKGEYYLTQSPPQPPLFIDSPCVDAGSAPSKELGLYYYTTSTNHRRDTGRVDLGYHYSVPIAKIVAQPAEGRTPLGVQFYGDRSEGDIVSYLWDFGDGTTSNLPNPGKTFINDSRQTKIFIVTLTVTDKDGISASATAQIKVKLRAMSWF